jgi:UDP-2,3-diacylglucosamine hydrolase
VTAGIDALFVSDLHLGSDTPRTNQAFLDFLQGPARQTKRLFILGDLFEVWLGDDALDDPDERGWLAPVVAALQAVSREADAFFMHGNRDFLVGPRFADTCGLVLLDDPTRIELNGEPLLLAHGDALCIDDMEYMRFRGQMRDPAWQRHILARPLAERRALARQLRGASEGSKQQKSMELMDVNPGEVERVMGRHVVARLVQGHTHRPAHHIEPYGERWVLPDWDFDHVNPPRGGYLSLQGQRMEAVRY